MKKLTGLREQPGQPKAAAAKAKLQRFLVIEDSGLGHVLCNAKKTILARTALEAAVKATQCPVDMVVRKDTVNEGVWEAFDIVSHKGWANQTDPAHIAVMEGLVEKGHMKRFVNPDRPVAYDPINQWIVTVVRR